MYQIASQRIFIIKHFRWGRGGGMPPDPARKLVAFGHSGTLNYKVIRLLIWDYFVLSLAAMCYSTAGTTYSFFDPVLGPHLQSVRFYNNNNNNNNNNNTQ